MKDKKTHNLYQYWTYDKLYLLKIHAFSEADGSHLWIQMEDGLSPGGEQRVHNLSVRSLVCVHSLHQPYGGSYGRVFRDVKGEEDLGEDGSVVIDVSDVDLDRCPGCVGAIGGLDCQSVCGPNFSVKSLSYC